MHSLKEIQLKCNKQFIVNFDGGELSSDGGLLMIREFLHILGIEKILKSSFKTNDPASFRLHKDDENLLQMIYQIFGTYYEDNCADEIRKDPILTAFSAEEFRHSSIIQHIPLRILLLFYVRHLCQNQPFLFENQQPLLRISEYF